jgi:hypothetical protein
MLNYSVRYAQVRLRKVISSDASYCKEQGDYFSMLIYIVAHSLLSRSIVDYGVALSGAGIINFISAEYSGAV